MNKNEERGREKERMGKEKRNKKRMEEREVRRVGKRGR